MRVPAEDALAAGLDAYAVEPDKFPDGLDLVVSFGGDGTMLYTVQLVYPAAVPIIGVNVGQLAYLSEIEPDELEDALPRLVARQFRGVRAHGARGRRRIDHRRGGNTVRARTKRCSRSSAPVT